MCFTHIFKCVGAEVSKVFSNEFCVFYFSKKICICTLETFFLIKQSKNLIMLSKNKNKNLIKPV